MNAKPEVGSRIQRLSWSALGVAAALLALPACSRPRNGLPDKSTLACAVPSSRAGESFGAAMQAAMARMDAAMNMAPSGDSDRDFATMMIPHHQGAVDMAVAELRFGRNEPLRRLAAGIVVEQRSEITLMEQILAELRAPHVSPPVGRPNEMANQLGAWK